MSRPAPLPILQLQLSPGEPSPTTPQSPYSPLSAEPGWVRHGVLEIVGCPKAVIDEAGQPGARRKEDLEDDELPLSSISTFGGAAGQQQRAPNSASSWPLLATIPLTHPDPFTLDPLSRLLRLCLNHKTDLVLARVTTTSSTGALFHDIYPAHAINKVLFRTQPEEGLLHRMKCRNPLNNLEVVGDVWYYRVPVDEIRRKVDLLKRTFGDHMLQPKSGQEPRRISLSSAWAAAAELVSPVLARGRHKMALSGDYSPLSTGEPGLDTVMRTLPSPATVNESARSSPLRDISNLDTRLIPPSPSKPSSATLARPASAPPRTLAAFPQTVSIRAEFFGTDDDFLMQAGIRAYFKAVSTFMSYFGFMETNKSSSSYVRLPLRPQSTPPTTLFSRSTSPHLPKIPLLNRTPRFQASFTLLNPAPTPIPHQSAS
jgi:hypothetical protein